MKKNIFTNFWNIMTFLFLKILCQIRDFFLGKSDSIHVAPPQRVSLSGDKIPDEFSVGVVYGPSGSGKSQLLAEIRAEINNRNAGSSSSSSSSGLNHLRVNQVGQQTAKEQMANLRTVLSEQRNQVIFFFFLNRKISLFSKEN